MRRTTRRQQAEQGRDIAQKGLQSAEKDRDEAVERRKEAALRNYHTRYVTDIKEEAPKLWKGNDVPRLLSLLDEHDPQKHTPAERAFIGFEWHYWWHLCHHELSVIPVESPVRSVAVSPDGKLVAGLNRRGEVLLWDAGGGKRLGVLPEKAGAFAFSPAGLRLALFTETGSVAVYDVNLDPRTGQTAFRPFGSCGRGLRFIQAVAFSPDGRRVAAATASLPVWDATTGNLIAELARLGQRTRGQIAGPNTPRGPRRPGVLCRLQPGREAPGQRRRGWRHQGLGRGDGRAGEEVIRTQGTRHHGHIQP
jgi:WD40 repeat protein